MVNEIVADFDGDGNLDGDVDTNNDGEIQVGEANAVLGLGITNKNILSLIGITSFVNIEDLRCSLNQLTSLDVTQCPNLEYLSCASNQMNNLDVLQNPSLRVLNCMSNDLTVLDVTQNPNLVGLYFNNNQVTAIDVSQNENLKVLFLIGNRINALDILHNIDLEQLDCRNNQLTVLDASQNPNLTFLSCFNNSLVSLNIKNGNNSNIDPMWAQGNQNLICIQVDDETSNFPFCTSSSGLCKDPWTEYSEDCILGFNDISASSFVLYPSLVRNVLRISGDNSIRSLKIYTLEGRSISTSNAVNIDVSHLSSGLYFAEITTENGRLVKKFLKE